MNSGRILHGAVRAFLRGFILLCIGKVAVAHGVECDGKYFTPEDTGNQLPLVQPHDQLEKKIQMAKAGVATAQRSLAVCYESGYLVSRCARDAEYWYRQAASAGDKIALEWVARSEQLKKMRAAPECVGQQCLGLDPDGARSVSFLAGAHGHYFAPVTINGVTLRGMFDTGASTLAMSRETARRFGINPLGGRQAMSMTANGSIANTVVTLPLVTIGGLALRDVTASIGISGETLIGMSFLSRFNVQMEAGRMTLSKRE